MSDFVELKEFPGYFIAHSPARLRRIINDKIIDCCQTPNSQQDNYWIVTVKTPEGKYVKRSMHRLLMETFIPNPENKAHVNHIDGDKSNNEMSNLEWATPQENSQHAYDIGLRNPDYKIKPVYQYNLSGEFIAAFPSDDAAQEATGIPKQNISKVTLRKRQHAGYFQWRRQKTEKITPVKGQYVKGYSYQNSFFTNLRELAETLGYSQPEKASMSRFKKSTQKLIKAIYYD